MASFRHTDPPEINLAAAFGRRVYHGRWVNQPDMLIWQESAYVKRWGILVINGFINLYQLISDQYTGLKSY